MPGGVPTGLTTVVDGVDDGLLKNGIPTLSERGDQFVQMCDACSVWYSPEV